MVTDTTTTGVTQILSSGPAGTKINIAVLGDGFAADDQISYNSAVDNLFIEGLFNNDFFLEQRSAFNIYRVNLISQESGVGTKKYDNGNLLSTVTKNTALGIYFSGSWLHCWLEDGPNTGTLINNALNQWVPDYTLILVLLNNPGYGGCGGGGRLTIPLGVTWDTVAHEFGHALGNLGDEYCQRDTAYTGSEPFYANLTINTEKESLKWANFIASTTPIPSGTGNCADYNQGTKPDEWSDNQSVGLFEGGGTFPSGIYRPVINCRMRSNLPPYCPVCYAQMESITRNHMGINSAQKPEDKLTVSDSSEGYVRLKIHKEDGKLSVTDVKEVPGSFITTKTVNPGYNYEILTGDQPITFGFLPDVGVRRSFANRDVPGREGKHHTTILPSFDFFVRVPKNYISERELPKITIAVHEVKQAPDRLLERVSLSKQSGVSSNEIGRMVGIRLDEVPKTVSSQLERIMKENAEPK